MDQRLFLVRHARAEGSNPGGDFVRALTPSGRAAFEAHVRSLNASLFVRRVVASPYLRAAQTAQIVASVFGVRADAEADLSPGASDARGVLRVAARYGPGTVLVGHNPELAAAAASAGGKNVELPPGAIVALDVVGRDLKLAWIRVP